MVTFFIDIAVKSRWRTFECVDGLPASAETGLVGVSRTYPGLRRGSLETERECWLITSVKCQMSGRLWRIKNKYICFGVWKWSLLAQVGHMKAWLTGRCCRASRQPWMSSPAVSWANPLPVLHVMCPKKTATFWRRQTLGPVIALASPHPLWYDSQISVNYYSSRLGPISVIL